MIRVLVVNEIQLMGNIVAASIEDESDIQVVGTATTIKEALTLMPSCDVALISTRMSDDQALALTQVITQNYPAVKILALGLAESEAEIMRYVEAGAAGYVLQDDSIAELLRGVRAAYNGEALVSPEVAAALISRVSELSQYFAETAAIPEAIELTPREHDVLELLAQDYSNQAIADQLTIEVGTVKNHVHSILQKLNVNNRQDAAAYWAILQQEDA